MYIKHFIITKEGYIDWRWFAFFVVQMIGCIARNYIIVGNKIKSMAYDDPRWKESIPISYVLLTCKLSHLQSYEGR